MIIFGFLRYCSMSFGPIFQAQTLRPSRNVFSSSDIARTKTYILSPASTTMAKYGMQSKAWHAFVALSKSSAGMLSGSLSLPMLLLRLLTEIPITSLVCGLRAIRSIPVWSTFAHSNPYFDRQYRTRCSAKSPVIFECRELFDDSICADPT